MATDDLRDLLSSNRGQLLRQSTQKPKSATAVVTTAAVPDIVPPNSHSNVREIIRRVINVQSNSKTQSVETQTSVKCFDRDIQTGQSYIGYQQRSVGNQSGETFIPELKQTFFQSQQRVEPAPAYHLNRYAYNFGTHQVAVDRAPPVPPNPTFQQPVTHFYQPASVPPSFQQQQYQAVQFMPQPVQYMPVQQPVRPYFPPQSDRRRRRNKLKSAAYAKRHQRDN